MDNDLSSLVFHIIQKEGPISTRAIISQIRSEFGRNVESEKIHSLLYGELREQVVRDKDEEGYPLWRIKLGKFEAAKGLEVMFYQELLRNNIIAEQDGQLGYAVRNRRNGKTYDLDIAIVNAHIKLNIEIDGFEHIRADARLSIQEQVEKRSENAEIEIDWMDNKNSFTDFKLIDNKHLFKWFAAHRNWVKRYHEELLKPHDITRNIWLIENGWRVMRFWNFEIKEEMKRCVGDVRMVLG